MSFFSTLLGNGVMRLRVLVCRPENTTIVRTGHFSNPKLTVTIMHGDEILILPADD